MHSPTIHGIDTHAHIFHPDLPMVANRRYEPAYEARLPDWLAHQDAAGLSHGVLIQPSFLGTDNSAIEAALLAHPERLRGVAVVGPDVSPEELDRLTALGFVGARLNLVGKDMAGYGSSLWQGFFARLAERHWQVEIQRSFDDLAEIIPVMADTGVTVMIDHFGLPQGGIDPTKPRHSAVLDMLETRPNLWVKLSAPYRSGLTPDLATEAFHLLREACGGIDRFVWGSDWPHTQHESAATYADQVAWFTRLLPDPAERTQILRDNPATLFRFA